MSTSTTGTAAETDTVMNFIGEVLAKRSNPAFAGWTAAVRSALTPATETLAYPYTEAHLGQVPPSQRAGLRRAAGITASHSRAPHSSSAPIGANLRHLYQALHGEAPERTGIANAFLSQMGSLPMLDVEQAAMIFDTLIGRCAGNGTPVNYFDLTQTLRYWGNGVAASSQETRAKVLRDFYTPRPTTTSSSDPTTRHQ